MAVVDRGAFVFSFRDGASRLALWLSPVVDLTKAAPSLFQNPPSTVVLQTSFWIAAFIGAFVCTRVLERRALPAAVLLGVAFEVAAMVAASLVWRSNHVAAGKILVLEDSTKEAFSQKMLHQHLIDGVTAHVRIE